MTDNEASLFENGFERYKEFCIKKQQLNNQEKFKKSLIDLIGKFSDIEIISNCKHGNNNEKFWSNIIIKSSKNVNENQKITIYNEDLLKIIMETLLEYINKEIDNTKMEIDKI